MYPLSVFTTISQSMNFGNPQFRIEDENRRSKSEILKSDIGLQEAYLQIGNNINLLNSIR